MSTFAELFRNSRFVKFNPKKPQIITSTRHDPNILNRIAFCENNNVDLELRPRFFGLKKDMPSRYYGQTPEYVRVKKLEGPFGLPVIEDAKLEILHRNVQNLLFMIMGVRMDPNQSTQQQLLNTLFKQNNTLKHPVDIYGRNHEPLIPPSTRLQVGGRVLDRKDGQEGYEVDVAGLKGFVNNEDVRGSFYNLSPGSWHKFWIKGLTVNRMSPNASVNLVLSMK